MEEEKIEKEIKTLKILIRDLQEKVRQLEKEVGELKNG